MPADSSWESRCTVCGRCCFEKVEDEQGTIFHTRIPCRYLDVVSRRCRIYENRFAINPECIKLTPELVDTLRWLPDDCGYRQPRPVEGTPWRRDREKRLKGRGCRGKR